MNFSDFRKLLGADPWNRDPETLQARNASPEFERVAEEAEAFERKLQGAMEVPVDERLVEQLIALTGDARRSSPPDWLALAAAVMLAAGVVSVAWLQLRPPRDVHVYVQGHYAHDGAELLARATGPADPDLVTDILANFGMEADSALMERVRLAKFCPTPGGRGVHMIVDTQAGPVHLIFMPETPVSDGEEFRFDGRLAHLVTLATGSAALIGQDHQPLQELEAVVRRDLRPLAART